MISNVFFRSNYYSDGPFVFVLNDDGMGNLASSIYFFVDIDICNNVGTVVAVDGSFG